MKDGKFEIGDEVRFVPPCTEMEDVKKYHPLDYACVYCKGLITELTSVGPKVRVRNHLIEGWPRDFFTPVIETDVEETVQERHIAGLSSETIDPEAYRDFMRGLA